MRVINRYLIQDFLVAFGMTLAMAGFTSLISILQVVSAGFQEKFGLTRRKVLLLFLGLLVSEWILRKRRGML